MMFNLKFKALSYISVAASPSKRSTIINAINPAKDEDIDIELSTAFQ